MKFHFFFRLLAGFLFVSNSLSATGVFAYVTNAGSNSVSVIDTASNTVINTTSVGFFPAGIAAAPAGDFVYATMYMDDTVHVIDTASNGLLQVINLPTGSKPIDIAVSPSGFPWVTNFTDATITMIDPSTMGWTTILPVGSIFPVALAITPNGSKAYIVNAVGPKNVKVFSLMTNSLVKSVNSGTQSFGIAITPDGSKAYSTNSLQSTVTVINTATDTISASVVLPLNSFPRGIAISPNGAFAYVVEQGTSSVDVINTTTNLVVANIPLTSNSDPFHIAITPDSLFAYVTQTIGDTVAVIDLTTNTMISTISVGNLPWDVAIANVP